MSPNAAYAKGTRAERHVMRFLEQRGWYAMRAYASKGPFDVLAIKRHRAPLMIEVKSGLSRTPGWLPPATRIRILDAAAPAGAKATTAHYERGLLQWWLITGPSLAETIVLDPDTL